MGSTTRSLSTVGFQIKMGTGGAVAVCNLRRVIASCASEKIKGEPADTRNAATLIRINCAFACLSAIIHGLPVLVFLWAACSKLSGHCQTGTCEGGEDG